MQDRPMSTADALLRDICENPEDDTPRLVYADWLDEHGDADRAELIRVQCEQARLPKDDPRGKELSQRAEELLREHDTDWVGALPWPTGVRWCAAYKRWRYAFKRGFVVQANFSSARAFR